MNSSTNSSTERCTAPVARRYAAPSLELRGRRFDWGAQTYVMGILNVTPDSFSGDGLGHDIPALVQRARRFEADGADLLDVGAESSRPGAPELPPDDELARLMPAFEAIRAATNLPITVDTYHPSVAEAALVAGADAVNDIWGLRHDPAMAKVVAKHRVPVVAMHNQRGRERMDVIEGLRRGWQASLDIARAAGIPSEHIILDPGFGFGWTPEQNLELIRRMPELWHFELPILLGTSRKSTLGYLLDDAPAQERLEATLATVAAGAASGIDIVRVHDVREVARVAKVADAIARANWTYAGKNGL